ncbi:hypothetical protein Enr10x_41290 [Gimesia panareensis]|uniref:Uncharacterized protein n=1 Tax=Gimesia panareensis TaxID=2527978 RepID=A0A517QAX6_9PLAN|nr:hypothetical protein Enr10x_41290 [Gimesia panareensis]
MQEEKMNESVPYKTLFVKTCTRADPGSRETKGAYKSSSLYGDL